ncbi:hypothetical protein [Nocardioides stalactiti]|uniref:hypothetical protein n=1 Tax=Nocardioides stalactiti TaxID=2755356 RepID=UPI001602C3D7|nr:hypothetical protein [Nocardioides stalactiti]
MTPWHMGNLHPVEQVLTIVLAFGPFLLLGAVILVRRRQDAREDAADRDAVAHEADRAGDDSRER